MEGRRLLGSPASGYFRAARRIRRPGWCGRPARAPRPRRVGHVAAYSGHRDATAMLDRLLAASVLFLGVRMTDAEAAGPAPPPPRRGRPIGAADAARLPGAGDRVAGRLRVHPRRQGPDLPEVGVQRPHPRPLAGRGRRPAAPGRRPAPGRRGTPTPTSRRRRPSAASGMRLRDTGITQVVRAAKADVAVIPLNGDLYLQRGDGPLERLTETPAPEIDPKPTADGSKVAFVRDGELFVLDLATGRRPSSPRGADRRPDPRPRRVHRAGGDGPVQPATGGRPTASLIAYQETDERHVPRYTIAHQGGDDPSVETHRYPVRRRRQRQGPARRDPGRRRRDPLARLRRARPTTSTSPA